MQRKMSDMSNFCSKILMIADEFPPQPGGRSEKLASHVKYLHRYGWKTVVLTPEPWKQSIDEHLMARVPEETIVCRTNYFFRNRFPNLRRKPSIREHLLDKLLDLVRAFQGFVRWVPYAIFAGLKLIKHQEVDVIHSMNNPVTNHLIAYVLHKLTGKPWVAEFRDPWVAYLYNARGPEVFDRILERKVIRSATRVVWYSTLQMADDYFLTTYPNQPADKFHQIPFFGYDSEEFEDIWQTRVEDLTGDMLRLSYVGSFYEGGISPDNFLKGLAKFMREYSLGEDHLRVTFAGSWGEKYSQMVTDLGLKNIVEYIGYVSRSKCLDLYQSSHILLLICTPEGEDFPSKFWDYLGARRVILGLLPLESFLAKCIIQEKLGVIAPPDNVEAISNSIMILYRKFLAGDLGIAPTQDFLNSASRASSERRFVRVLEDILEKDIAL
jgi:glycosyltransferase involved in cell wall biosynthesis